MTRLSDTLLELYEGFVNIEDAIQLKGAVECAAQISRHARELDKERLEMTKGARTTVDSINKMFNAKIGELRHAAEQVVGAMQYYFREHDLTTADGALGSKANMRDRYTWTVEDFSLVPDELKLPHDQCVNRGELAKLAKQQKVDESGALTVTVPGIRFMPIAQMTLLAATDIE